MLSFSNGSFKSFQPQKGDARSLVSDFPLPPGNPPKAAALRVLTLDEFQGLEGLSSVIHLKGFNQDVCDSYHNDILQRLAGCSLLVWDGLWYNETGFTALIPQFLRQTPGKQVCAFKNMAGVNSFMSSWSAVAHEFPGRVSVVALNLREVPDSFAGFVSAPKFGADSPPLGALEASLLENLPQDARDQMRLARIALKATGSKRVLALGGPGVHGREAEASFSDGVHWTVFACSRGQKEGTPSLLDWAATMARQRPVEVELVTGRDPMEADGFAGVPSSGSRRGFLERRRTGAMVEDVVSKLLDEEGSDDEAADSWNGQLPGAMEARTPKHDKAFERLRRESDCFRQFGEFGTEPPEPSTRFDDGSPGDAVESAKTKPDMSGTWVASGGPEGMDGFLELMGMNWLARKAAQQMMKTFTPKMEITCEGDGEQFLVISHTPKGINSSEFFTNGEEFEGLFGPDKAPGKGTAHWEGNDLKLVVRLKDMTMETTRSIQDSGSILFETVKAKKDGKSALMSRRYAHKATDISAFTPTFCE